MSPIDGNNRFSQSYVFSNIVNLVSIETFIAPDCGLMGTIPSEIGNLQNLIKLNIQDNQLTGIVPESICDLNIDLMQLVSGIVILIFVEIIYACHILHALLGIQV